MPDPDAADSWRVRTRAAGATPIHKDEPGYAPHLDRDGDGVACETYPP
ncbi:excalibur calcium-binding domain-containing protein [Streptomyces sp. NPDC012637]